MSFINKKDLIAQAAVDSSLVKRPVEWKRVNAEGVEVTDNYDVFVVKDISFAASDRVYLGDNTTGDSSRYARLISERIRLGTKGEERFTHEEASALESSLGWSLVKTITDYDKEVDAKKDPKTSAKKTKSGTN
jgi:hypothetical protein